MLRYLVDIIFGAHAIFFKIFYIAANIDTLKRDIFLWSAVTPMATRHQGNARDSGSSQNGVRSCLGICKTNPREFIDHTNEEKMEETFNEDLRHV